MVEEEITGYTQPTYPERPAEPKSEAAGNVLELLDRILDKGLVIVGDIRISVADIELLKIQIRLLIASVDKAKELGIDFAWAKEIEQTQTKKELEEKIMALKAQVQQQMSGPGQDKSPTHTGFSDSSGNTHKPAEPTTNSEDSGNTDTGLHGSMPPGR
jgi:hypothetical protein